MEIIENKKIVQQDGYYLRETEFIADKLKNEKFPSDELREKYPEDFVHIEKHTTSIIPPENSGEIGVYSGCIILID